MPLQNLGVENTTEDGHQFIRQCSNCAYQQLETPGLVMETTVQEKVSETFRVVLNEFTKNDPRIPHVKNLKCPNEACPTRAGKEPSDVMYIKYDAANLKFLYICTRCDTQWRSR
jgi:DNA-directed RNA polymerase subunit M/transcription elongation factor TFIIS